MLVFDIFCSVTSKKTGDNKQKRIFPLRKNKVPTYGINKNATASLWYSASNLFSRGIGFLFTPIFTRMLPPEEYGVYSLYVSLMGIFTVLISFEISGSLMYKGMAKFNTGGRCDYVSASLGAALLLYIGALLIYLPAHGAINRLTGLNTLFALILITQVFLNTAEGLFFGKCRYEGRYKSVTAINLISGLLTPLLSLALIKMGLGGTARIISPLIVSTAISAVLIAIILKESRRIYTPEAWRFIFRIAPRLLPHYLALSIIAQSDKLIVARMYGSESLGMYSVAYSLGFMLSLITGGLLLALTPWIIKMLAAGEYGRVRRVSEISGRLVAVGTLIFLTLLPELYSLFAPREYSPALPVAYTIAVSVFFSFFSSVLSSVLMHFERPMKLTRGSVISALAAIGTAYAAGRLFGWQATALALPVAHLILSLQSYISIWKISGKRAINVKSCFQTSLFLTASSVFLFLVREVPTARLLFLAALLLMATRELILNRGMIIKRRRTI